MRFEWVSDDWFYTPVTFLIIQPRNFHPTRIPTAAPAVNETTIVLSLSIGGDVGLGVILGTRVKTRESV